jgi:hypothetical protein
LLQTAAERGLAVQCSCGHRFCFACHDAPHEPASCEQVGGAAELQILQCMCPPSATCFACFGEVTTWLKSWVGMHWPYSQGMLPVRSGAAIASDCHTCSFTVCLVGGSSETLDIDFGMLSMCHTLHRCGPGGGCFRRSSRRGRQTLRGGSQVGAHDGTTLTCVHCQQVCIARSVLYITCCFWAS